MAESGPKVLVLAWDDESDEDSLSGMPWNMRRALELAGCQVTVGQVGAFHRTSEEFRAKWRRWRRMRGMKTLARNTAYRVLPQMTRGRLDRVSRDAARAADEVVRASSADVVFGPGMSMPIGFMKTDRPILYASDATAALVCHMYDDFRKRGRAYRNAFMELETAALARADRTVLASDWTRRSAIEDHHADPDRVSVVPMGANVEVATGTTVEVPASPPTPDDLGLLLVAADPIRKRIDLCVEIMRELRGRGWRATLHYVGPPHPATRVDGVEWAGRLSLKDPEDRKVHRSLLHRCHVGIMPSTAEMFGIAPIESAAYGRPSIVSDAGGLPTVVLDGETGRVVPVDAPVSDWADAVVDVVQDPARYASISTQAHRRFDSVLNWGAWGRTVRGLIEAMI